MKNDQQQLMKMPPVWVFSTITNLRIFLKKLYFNLVPSSMAVFEKTQGIWIAKALGVACELNLAEIVGNDEKPIEEIARESNTNASALYRLMRALASEGIFNEVSHGTFKNNSYSKALMEGPGNLKHMIIHQLNETNCRLVTGLSSSITTGNSYANEILGSDIFTHLKNSPEKNKLYNKAMGETSLLSSAAIISAYDFNVFDSLVDYGGGTGTLLYTILKKNQTLKGILFDLPHVVEKGNKLANDFGVNDRVEIIPGDFFIDSPPSADAYLLKNILHIFDDESCIRLLKSINETMNRNGKILIVEAVVGKDNKPGFGKMFDLQMLIATDKGKERTEKEYKLIFEAAGFSLTRVIKTVSPFSIVEGQKK